MIKETVADQPQLSCGLGELTPYVCPARPRAPGTALFDAVRYLEAHQALCRSSAATADEEGFYKVQWQMRGGMAATPTAQPVVGLAAAAVW